MQLFFYSHAALIPPLFFPLVALIQLLWYSSAVFMCLLFYSHVPPLLLSCYYLASLLHLSCHSLFSFILFLLFFFSPYSFSSFLLFIIKYQNICTCSCQELIIMNHNIPWYLLLTSILHVVPCEDPCLCWFPRFEVIKHEIAQTMTGQ